MKTDKSCAPAPQLVSDKAHSAKVGPCPLCERRTTLTFHHLIPKKMHRRTFFKKHFDKETLAKGIDRKSVV